MRTVLQNVLRCGAFTLIVAAAVFVAYTVDRSAERDRRPVAVPSEASSQLKAPVLIVPQENQLEFTRCTVPEPSPSEVDHEISIHVWVVVIPV